MDYGLAPVYMTSFKEGFADLWAVFCFRTTISGSHLPNKIEMLYVLNRLLSRPRQMSTSLSMGLMICCHEESPR